MSIDEKIQAFLAKSAAQPGTRLEPYRELIQTLRKRRWKYRQILEVLRQEFGVTVSLSALHSFAKKIGGPALAAPATPIPPAAAKRPRFNLDA